MLLDLSTEPPPRTAAATYPESILNSYDTWRHLLSQFWMTMGWRPAMTWFRLQPGSTSLDLASESEEDIQFCPVPSTWINPSRLQAALLRSGGNHLVFTRLLLLACLDARLSFAKLMSIAHSISQKTSFTMSAFDSTWPTGQENESSPKKSRRTPEEEKEKPGTLIYCIFSSVHLQNVVWDRMSIYANRSRCKSRSRDVAATDTGSNPAQDCQMRAVCEQKPVQTRQVLNKERERLKENHRSLPRMKIKMRCAVKQVVHTLLRICMVLHFISCHCHIVHSSSSRGWSRPWLDGVPFALRSRSRTSSWAVLIWAAVRAAATGQQLEMDEVLPRSIKITEDIHAILCWFLYWIFWCRTWILVLLR